MNESQIVGLVVEYGLPQLVNLVKLLIDEIQKKATTLEEANAAVAAIEGGADVAAEQKFGKSDA